jgi:hypothetical protein
MTFVDELFLFPTALFTAGLGLCALYWAFVLIGAIGIDAIDLDGLFDGAGGIDGAAEGAMEGAMDGALDGTLDGAMEGAIDGAMDAAAEVGDGVTDAAGEGGSGPSFFVSVAHALALGKAPATVVFSLLFLWAWALSMAINHYVVPAMGLNPVLAGTGVFLAALAGGVGLTNRCAQPMGRLFEVKEAARRTDAVGRACEIRTGRVTSTFGQAEAKDGGAGLVIEVRCEEPNTLKKGDEALVISFDRAAECYWVEPMESLLADRPSAHRINSVNQTHSATNGNVDDAAFQQEELEAVVEQEVESM